MVLREPESGSCHPGHSSACMGHTPRQESQTQAIPLMGRPGGLGRGEVLWGSPSAPLPTGLPKMASSSLASGGGMGYLPMDSSTKDRPMLQMSDCTE